MENQIFVFIRLFSSTKAVQRTISNDINVAKLKNQNGGLLCEK
jgi:hypothetical protein